MAENLYITPPEIIPTDAPAKHRPISWNLVLNGSIGYGQPVVSMDTSIGEQLKKGEYIDVDYAALEKLFRPEKEENWPSIELVHPKSFGVSDGGKYAYSTNEITLAWRRSVKSVQRKLQHEVHHSKDPKAKNTDSIYTKIANIGAEGLIAARRLVPSVLLLQASHHAEREYQTNSFVMDLAEDMPADAIAILLFVVSSISIAAHTLSPIERSARKAEKPVQDIVFKKLQTRV